MKSEKRTILESVDDVIFYGSLTALMAAGFAIVAVHSVFEKLILRK